MCYQFALYLIVRFYFMLYYPSASSFHWSCLDRLIYTKHTICPWAIEKIIFIDTSEFQHKKMFTKKSVGSCIMLVYGKDPINKRPTYSGKKSILFRVYWYFNFIIALFAGKSLKLKKDYINLGFSVDVTVCLKQGFLGGTNRYRCIRHITSPPLTTFVVFF